MLHALRPTQGVMRMLVLAQSWPKAVLLFGNAYASIQIYIIGISVGYVTIVLQ